MSKNLACGAGLIASVLMVIAGCAAPIPITQAPQTVDEAAKAVLSTLPELRITLPASLSGQSAGLTASSRAVGATTDLSTVTLPTLKSQAWYDLQGNGGNAFLGFINRAFDVVRSYAKDHAIENNVVFSINLSSDAIKAIVGSAPPSTLVFTDQFRVVGTSASNFSLYFKVEMKDSVDLAQMARISGRFDVTLVGSERVLDMYFLINFSSQNGSQELPFYAHYDTATKACDLVYSGTTSSTHASTTDGATTSETQTNTIESIQRSRVASNGSIASVSVNRYDDSAPSVYAAYGDDIAGGIASFYPSWGNSGSRYWGEYYDDKGNLLLRSSGSTTPRFLVGTVVNLKDYGFTSPPLNPQERRSWTGQQTVIKIKSAAGNWIDVARYGYDGTNWTHELSSDGGSTWTVVPSWIEIAYKADPSAWTAGDVVYYWQSGQYDSDSSAWTSTLYQGYVVPASTYRFGKNFFLTDEYPLSQILPLTTDYASQYQLIQEEGNTHSSSWTDNEGKSHDWSWTNYKYYLNKNVSGESPIRLDLSQGDIDLDSRLEQYDMYYWYGGTTSKVKAYFFQTSGVLPPYFTQPSRSAVDHVDAGLQKAMADAYLLDVTDYAAQLAQCLADPAADIF